MSPFNAVFTLTGKQRSPGDFLLAAAGVLFALFVLNILLGRLQTWVPAVGAVRQNAVIECAMLVAAVICFVAATMRRERFENTARNRD